MRGCDAAFALAFASDLLLETVDGDRDLATLNSNAKLEPDAVTQKGAAAAAQPHFNQQRHLKST
jgi:hypothetical protein